MNFDYSVDAKALRSQARDLFASAATSAKLHEMVKRGEQHDGSLWAQASSLGWAGPQVSEALGGVDAEPELLCALAEAVGMTLAPIPLMSSAIFSIEAIRMAGSREQQARWLPELASGTMIGAVAIHDAAGHPRARVRQGLLTATKAVVCEAMISRLCVLLADDEAGVPALYLASLGAAGASRVPMQTLDLLRGHARVEFVNVPVQRLDGHPAGAGAVDAWLDRIAVYRAFEQLGGAQACLDMAVAYAKQRMAFGRLIGSFQAIKHKLADMYVAIELARSNCYYAASELQSGTASLALAASAALQAATQAYEWCAKENIQTHGGFGFTWEADCHLHYRRSKALAVSLGHPARWRDRLVDALAA